MKTYAHPEYLVDTDWVAKHLEDPAIRIIESDEDALLYAVGHLPNAQQLDWFTTLQHPLRRDFLSKEAFEQLCSKLGIANDTPVIFYGDKNNWFACYALWLFKYYGHADVRIMNGGRAKWQLEGRTFTREMPKFPQTNYFAQEPDRRIRAFRDEVLNQVIARKPLVDVRSPKEYSGELLHMESYPQEGATRGGHIPGAVNIPWSQAIDPATGQFLSVDSLETLYAGQGITPEKEIIAYCRIGERSALTWFALKYLLGYPNVRNYDGSWTEWGNLVNAPIEK